MPKGRIVRQDDKTKETLKIAASKKIDRPTLESMISEEGPLASGALPSFKAASVAGQQKLQESLDEEGKKVEKAKAKPKARPKEPETIEPKTTAQCGFPRDGLTRVQEIKNQRAHL